LSLCGEGLRFQPERQEPPGRPAEATDSNCVDLVKWVFDVRDSPGESQRDGIRMASAQAVGVPGREPEAERRPDRGCLLFDSFGTTPVDALGDQSSTGSQ